MLNNRLVDEHIRRNNTTRDSWDAMAPHRARVTKIITDAIRETDTSLCILGAGNGNDIELDKLALEFQRVALIDLDSKAIEVAVDNLSSDHKGLIECYGGVDLTGLLSTFGAWKPRETVSKSKISDAIEFAKVADPPDVGSFDIVCSTCILTQLIDSVCMVVPSGNPQFVDLLLAVRNRHLDMIIQLLNPGGLGILITDFVSSVTAPEIPELDESDFPQAALRWIEQRNFFTGANPLALLAHYQNNPLAASLVQQVHLGKPWRWDIGFKQFAVCSVCVRLQGKLEQLG